MIENNCSIGHMSKLSVLYTSSVEKPNISIYKDDRLGLIIEVDSSVNDFQSTVQKTIIACVNIIRLFRNYDTKYFSYSGFAFPKFVQQQVVIKIMVTFEDLVFKYYLTPIQLKEDVAQHVCSAIDDNLRKSPLISTIDHTKVKEEYIIRLSPIELNIFSNGPVKQLKNENNLMMDNGTEILKIPAYSSVSDALHTLRSKLVESPNARVTSIQYKTVGNMSAMMYSKVVHNSLSVHEIRRCAYFFTKEILLSLQSLHDIVFAHCDIKSDNICVNTDYQLVLIDLDRVTPSTYQVPEKTYGKSCMYKIPCMFHLIRRLDCSENGFHATRIYAGICCQ